MKDSRVVARMWSPYAPMNGYYSLVGGGGYVNKLDMARVFFPGEAETFFKKARRKKPADIDGPLATILVPLAEAKDLSVREMTEKPVGHSIWPEKDFA